MKNQPQKIEYRIQRQINWEFEVVSYNPSALTCRDQVKLIGSFPTREEAEAFVISKQSEKHS